MKWSG